MKRIRGVWLSVLLTLGAGSAIVMLLILSGDQSGRDQVEEQALIRVGVQNNVVSAPLFVAARAGYFKDEGLNVRLTRYPSGKLAFEAMSRGENDFATCSDIVIVSHSFDRDDFGTLCAFATSLNALWIVARADRGIKTPADFKGKTIATQENSAVDYFTNAFMISNGLSAKDVTVKYMNAVDLPEAIANGDVDAIAMRNPYNRLAKEALKHNAIEFFEPNVYRMTFNLVSRDEIINQRSNATLKLLNAIKRAERLIRDNPRRAMELTALSLGEKTLNCVQAEWDKYHFSLRLDQALLLTLEDQARWVNEFKRTEPRARIPNYLNFIYSEPLSRVAPDAIGLFAAPSDRVSISVPKHPASAPILIAIENGYFEAEGVRVQLDAFCCAKVALGQMIRGKDDLCLTNCGALAATSALGGKARILASLASSKRDLVVAVRVGDGVDSVKDLRGKRVICPTESSGEWLLESKLMVYGMSLRDIKLTRGDPDIAYAALLKGETDAAVTWRHLALQVQERLGDKLRIFDGKGLYYEYYCLVHPANVRLAPEEARKITRALLRAENFIKTNPKASQAIVAKALGINPQLIERIWPGYHFAMTLDYPLLMTLRERARWTAKRAGIPDRHPDFASWIDPWALRELAPDAVSIPLN